MNSQFDPLAYWEERHVELSGDYRNVGNRSLSSQQNYELLLSKSLIIAHALGAHGIQRGARLLDAGCGCGVLTEHLRLAGFDMTGIDGSPTAIAAARSISTARYVNAILSAYNAHEPFNAVLCLDVLLHIVDDDEWRRSVRSLIANVAESGLLVLIETFGLLGQHAPPHIRWRHRESYLELFQPHRAHFIAETKFQYPHEGADKTLLVARVAGQATTA